jgi:hypothetical protein
MNAILGAGYAAVLFAFATVIWRRWPKRRRPSEAERVAAARARVGLAADPRWGTDAASQNACELIWDLPEYEPELDAGCARLLKAIRDEQQQGDE